MKKTFFILINMFICLSFYGQINWVNRSGIEGLSVHDIAIKKTGEIFFVRDTGSVLFSDNNGDDWSYRSLAIPSDINTVATSNNGDVYVGTTYLGVFKSIDNGLTWTHNSMPGTQIRDIEIDSLGQIYVLKDTMSGAESAYSLYTSTDNGLTWNSILLPTPSGFDYYKFLSITENGELFLCNSNYESYYSLDNGSSWISMGGYYFREVRKNFITGEYFLVGGMDDLSKVSSWPGTPVIVTSFLWNDPSDMVIASNGELYVACLDVSSSWHYLYYSNDNGITWIGSGASEYNPSCVAYNPISGNVFYGNENQSGIFCYNYRCVRRISNPFTPFYNSENVTTHMGIGGHIVSNNVYSSLTENKIYATDLKTACGTTPINGLMESINNGASWKTDTAFRNYHSGFVVQDPFNGNTFASVRTFANYGWLKRKQMDSTAWVDIYVSLDTAVRKMEFSPNGDIYAILVNGRIYKSSDGGIAWILFPTPFSPVSMKSFICTNNGTLLASSSGPSPSPFRSVDGGVTWNTTLYNGGVADDFYINRMNNEIYLVDNSWAHLFYRSSDDGITWDTLGTNTFLGGLINDMYFNSCGQIYLAANDVHRSDDGGSTWNLDNLGLLYLPANLAFSAEGYLFESDNAGFITRSEFPLNSYTACVLAWPGDADNDLQVDNTDLLQIGLYYGNTGFPRVTTSNNWQGYVSSDWGVVQYNGSDIKHVDSNGDGTINNADTLAVNQNYSHVHSRNNTNSSTSASSNQLYFTTSSNTYAPGQLIDVEIWAGSASLPVSDLYGVAFDVVTDQSHLVSSVSNFSYTSSWLGNSSSLVSMSHSGITLDGVVCRTSHIDTTGFGKIAELHIQSNPSIMTYTDIVLAFDSYKAIDQNGNQILFETLSDTIHIDPALLNINDLKDENRFAVYPNPVMDKVTVSYQIARTTDVKIEIVDFLGRKIETHVFNSQTEGHKAYQLYFDNVKYNKGVYFIHLVTDGKVSVKRIVKM